MDSCSIFADYFRCPENLGDIDHERLAVSEVARGVDMADRISRQARALPFRRHPTDSSSLIDIFARNAHNLRLERYARTSPSKAQFSSLYYLLRPLLTLQVRRFIHRRIFKSRQMGFPRWPVDCTVDDMFHSWMELAVRLQAAEELPFIWFWPEGHASAVMMTHDVEEEVGARNCEMLMDLDQSFNLRSAFQLIPEGRYTGVQELIAQIRLRGFEANLHDLDHDGRLFADLRLFKERAKKINMYARQYCAKGFRAGSMHRNQAWMDLLDFEYDMSVPNVAHLEPQGGGCCTVMPYFIGDTLELPLTTTQDHGLFYILKEKSIDLWKKQLQLIFARHGLASFIVHPDYVVQERERQMYRDLLGYLSGLMEAKNIWFAVPGEVNAWWRQRREMQLYQSPSGWRIQGTGSERARVAFARVVAGCLVYSVEDRA